ncbi:HmuY family protein [Oligoflexus tunisiensis]|uniref:HmuY family protein n=1 Tax=Oligoflexus tunisiensis TaxID=708132 RepID=UPI001C403567|nr:HmuY family protein [Oligoflexus tunisiensis]
MLALCAFSCAEKKDKEDSVSESGNLAPLTENGESTAMEIDATSRTDWVGLDLDSAGFISVADLPNQPTWDLAFKRTSIKMNGADVQMQVVAKDFAAIELAPKDGYVSDQPSTAPEAVETAGLAFHVEPAWYAYDINTHVVSSRGLVYVIKSNEGRYFKLKFLDYYNAARLPAYINLEFQELQGVEP